MDSASLLTDSFARIASLAAEALDDADDDLLRWQPDPAANTVAWLIWHTARGQDAQVAELATSEQVWTEKGFAARFDLPFDDEESGYGLGPSDVAAVAVSSSDSAI